MKPPTWHHWEKTSTIDVQQSGQEQMQHVTGLKDHSGEEDRGLQLHWRGYTGVDPALVIKAYMLHLAKLNKKESIQSIA